MIQIVKTKSELKDKIHAANAASVGFVPTMGALHEGHVSLIKRAVEENDLVVASVFVNPTQFNDKNDLARYPRMPEADVKKLDAAGCKIVFMPDVEEMYPEEDTRIFDFGMLDKVMEGKYRPGHFNGVAQIVSKLFYAVEPDKAYFGEKDFQQVAIVKKMVEQLGLKVEIVPCPIIREASGLAKSSRNMLLTEQQREKAARIYKVLSDSVALAKEKSVDEVRNWVLAQFADDPEFKADYYEIVDGDNLQSVNDWKDSNYIVGCIAIYCGKIRLIDNIHYKG